MEIFCFYSSSTHLSFVCNEFVDPIPNLIHGRELDRVYALGKLCTAIAVLYLPVTLFVSDGLAIRRITDELASAGQQLQVWLFIPLTAGIRHRFTKRSKRSPRSIFYQLVDLGYLQSVREIPASQYAEQLKPSLHACYRRAYVVDVVGSQRWLQSHAWRC